MTGEGSCRLPIVSPKQMPGNKSFFDCRLRESFTYIFEKICRGLNKLTLVLFFQMYLSDAEFLRVFGMSKVEFYKKPKWKQVVLKKQMGLH